MKIIFLKKYIKNHKIIFFLKQNRGEEDNKRRAHTSTWLLYIDIYIYIYIGVYIAFIVFMINLAKILSHILSHVVLSNKNLV